ncbi:uncharacterized protein LOC121318120 [Polyodon spathula]|uniref:uncharacterized protein LOC121318120 n=1 Tax=Polyodon spathula TaxID=7913 RepID=UPI001B7D9CE4|nr:uncharacterized protein LOC121318120 [Polyodon spathula]
MSSCSAVLEVGSFTRMRVFERMLRKTKGTEPNTQHEDKAVQQGFRVEGSRTVASDEQCPALVQSGSVYEEQPTKEKNSYLDINTLKNAHTSKNITNKTRKCKVNTHRLKAADGLPSYNSLPVIRNDKDVAGGDIDKHHLGCEYSGLTEPMTKLVAPVRADVHAVSQAENCTEIKSKNGWSFHNRPSVDTCLITAEEFNLDDLDDSECSDVMTEYTNAIWQARVQGIKLLLLKEGDHSDDDLCLEKDHIVSSPEKVKNLMESSDSKAVDAISGGQSRVKKPAVYRSPSENNPSSKHREMVHTATQCQGEWLAIKPHVQTTMAIKNKGLEKADDNCVNIILPEHIYKKVTKENIEVTKERNVTDLNSLSGICEGELALKVKGEHLSETDKEELKGKIKDIAQSREENSTGIINSEKESALKQSGSLDSEKLCKWDLSNIVPKCENVIPMETKAILSDSSTIRDNCTEESLFTEKTHKIYPCERTSHKKQFGLMCEELNIQMTETRHYPSYLDCKESGQFNSSLEILHCIKAEAAENFNEPLDSLRLKNCCWSEDLNVEMDQHNNDGKTLSQTQYSSTATNTLDKPLQLEHSPSSDGCEFAKCSMRNQKVNLCNNTPRKDSDLKDILPTSFTGAEGSQERNVQCKARDDFQHTKESVSLRSGALKENLQYTDSSLNTKQCNVIDNEPHIHEESQSSKLPHDEGPFKNNSCPSTSAISPSNEVNRMTNQINNLGNDVSGTNRLPTAIKKKPPLNDTSTSAISPLNQKDDMQKDKTPNSDTKSPHPTNRDEAQAISPPVKTNTSINLLKGSEFEITNAKHISTADGRNAAEPNFKCIPRDLILQEIITTDQESVVQQPKETLESSATLKPVPKQNGDNMMEISDEKVSHQIKSAHLSFIEIDTAVPQTAIPETVDLSVVCTSVPEHAEANLVTVGLEKFNVVPPVLQKAEKTSESPVILKSHSKAFSGKSVTQNTDRIKTGTSKQQGKELNTSKSCGGQIKNVQQVKGVESLKKAPKDKKSPFMDRYSNNNTGGSKVKDEAFGAKQLLLSKKNLENPTPAASPIPRKGYPVKDNEHKRSTAKELPLSARRKVTSPDKSGRHSAPEETQSATEVHQQREEITKRMRLSGERTKGAPVEAKQQKQHLGENEHLGLKKKEGQRATVQETPKKNHNELHKKKHPLKEESKVPKVLRHIHAETFPDISGNIKLWCQFGDIYADSTITWSKDGVVLAKVQRSAGDDSPDSLAIVQATIKDQGMYQCKLKNPNGKMSSEFRLTSEALNELISKQDLEGGEEIKCAQLMFREDFLRDQYFGDDLLASIVTEEQHFGEGLHRKAFRTKVISGLMPVFNSGHACVLKVHNAIAYGTKNNDELIQKNYNLAVQECHVQNTAREYIKEYRAEIKCTEAFGEVPEIIPVYLIHRPANNIPYATLEEELVGDFVKYSVKDGKEMNMTRRDSDAGQKCCTFQHWVYKKTDGNLLVTDMQGVGMKLTDVGIATCGKGYKGFRGNCATSFIDQFNALHHCNKFCEMLGLKSLQSSQPKPRKTRGQPSSKKMAFLPHTKSKT